MNVAKITYYYIFIMKKSIFFALLITLSSSFEVLHAQGFRYWPVLDLWKSEAERAFSIKDYKKCVVEYDSIRVRYQKYSLNEVLINQATCAALDGDTTRAFSSVSTAVSKGYRELHHLQGNPFFERLSSYSTWQTLLQRCGENNARFVQRNKIELPEVREELLKMYDESQKFQQWNFYHQNYAMYPEYTPELLMKFKDETFKNQFARLIELSKMHDGSVFGKSKVGSDGAQIIIIIVQNANHDPVTQDAFAEAIEQSDKGEFQESDVAYLLDKRLKHAGKPQRYGTAYIFDSDAGKPTEMIEVEDPATLNDRRKSIGLEPLNKEWYK